MASCLGLCNTLSFLCVLDLLIACLHRFCLVVVLGVVAFLTHYGGVGVLGLCFHSQSLLAGCLVYVFGLDVLWLWGFLFVSVCFGV